MVFWLLKTDRVHLLNTTRSLLNIWNILSTLKQSPTSNFKDEVFALLEKLQWQDLSAKRWEDLQKEIEGMTMKEILFEEN